MTLAPITSLAALLLLTATTVAQRDAASLRAQLERLERRLTDVGTHEAELRRLLDRHANGDEIGEVRWLTVTDIDRGRAQSAASAGAATAIELPTAALRAQLASLESAVHDARQRAADRAAGDTRPRHEETARLAGPDAPSDAGSRTSMPVPPPLRTVASASDAQGREPATIIRGTADRARIGKVLVDAGIALLREAERLDSEGRNDAAAATRARARERLESARIELDAIARRPDDAPLSALFALARCEERLGRVANADELYRKIIDRDRVDGADGKSISGSFGRAARTARTVMRWLRDTGEWRPRRDVDSITWDDR